MDDKEVVNKIGAIDALFTGDHATKTVLQSRIKTHVLTMLRQHPNLLERLNFKASLRTPTQGPFFQSVAQALSEIPDLPPKELRYVIEVSRRGKNYDQLERFFAMQEQKLQGDESPDAENLRAKAIYELHMAAYQQAEDFLENDPEAAATLYQKSMDLAKISAGHAKQAKDEVGELFTLMNISSLLLPRMKQSQEGLAISQQVFDEATRKAQALPAGNERDSYLRIAMNMCSNRLPILIREKADPKVVREILRQLQESPFYPDCQNHENVSKIVDEALRYIEIEGKEDA